MKKGNPVLLGISFLFAFIFTVNSLGCGNNEKPDNQTAITKDQSILPGDTTITNDPLKLPEFIPDSLKILFEKLITIESDKIFGQYPAGYGILYIDFKGRYHGATRLDESRVILKWKNAKIQKLSETELQLWIPELNMESISMQGLTIPISLNDQPREAGISSGTLRMYSQLIAKTKDGIIVLLGFK